MQLLRLARLAHATNRRRELDLGIVGEAHPVHVKLDFDALTYVNHPVV